MDMPASSQRSFEKELSQCLENWKNKNLTISCVVAEPASMFRGNEGSPDPHHERGFKCNASRGAMGPRQGAVGKHRQQRHTSKGTIKVYPADLSNFRAVVYEHTSQLPPLDIETRPTSPLTPHSVGSISSTWRLMSQPSSPTTPHSIPSTSTSPRSSPHHGHPNGGLYLNGLPFEVHAEHGSELHAHFNPFEVDGEHNPHLSTHLNVRNSHPSLCYANTNLNPIHNTNFHQGIYVPRCASTPCLGVSNQADNAPPDDGRPHGLSPDQFARVLSLKRFLFDDDASCNALA